MSKNSLQISSPRNIGNPFREFARLQSDFDDMLRDMSMYAPLAMQEFNATPSFELEEDDKQFTAKLDMLGMKKSDVKVEVDGKRVTVSAERKEEKRDGKKTHYSELRYGSYLRSFTVPSQIKEDKIQAQFQDGVLTLTLPKDESTRSRKIEIQ